MVAIRVARKVHFCVLCGGEIFLGQEYIREVRVSATGLTEIKTHSSPCCRGAVARREEFVYGPESYPFSEAVLQRKKKLLWTQSRVARKIDVPLQQCFECGEPIDYGDEYLRFVWRENGRLRSYYRHNVCFHGLDPEDDERGEVDEKDEEPVDFGFPLAA